MSYDNLKKIDYHDSSIIELIVSFYKGEIVVKFEREMEVTTISYKEIKKLSFSDIDFFNNKDVEIYNVDYFNENNGIKVEFTLLLGFGLPSCQLSFVFKEYSISKTDCSNGDIAI